MAELTETGWWVVLVTRPGQPERLEFRSQSLAECEAAADEYRDEGFAVQVVPEVG